MSIPVPTGLLASDRVFEIDLGCRHAGELLDRIFPPREEDQEGALALTAVEVLANRALRTQVLARAVDRDRLHWWLEGFALGFAAAAVSVLDRAAGLGSEPVPARLDDMAEHILPRLAVEQQAAAQTAFALCHAVWAGDPMSLAWRLDTMWANPIVDPSSSTALLLERYQRTLVAALSIACASWQLLLLLEANPD